MQTRYVGRWIKRQHVDEIGEWIPDRDELGEHVSKSFEAARDAAIAGSRHDDCVEWVQISEQRFNKRLGMWQESQRWSGDYELQELAY